MWTGIQCCVPQILLLTAGGPWAYQTALPHGWNGDLPWLPPLSSGISKSQRYTQSIQVGGPKNVDPCLKLTGSTQHADCFDKTRG